MTFTNKLSKTLSCLAIALAFSNTASAATVEYNYNYSTSLGTIFANIFVNDADTDFSDGNIDSATITYNGNSYTFNEGYLLIDNQLNNATDTIFTSAIGYFLGLEATDGTNFSIYDFVGTKIDGSTKESTVATVGLTTLSLEDQDNTGTLTKVTTPVPEPETYGMMLVGLGLMGFTARRKKQDA